MTDITKLIEENKKLQEENKQLLDKLETIYTKLTLFSNSCVYGYEKNKDLIQSLDISKDNDDLKKAIIHYLNSHSKNEIIEYVINSYNCIQENMNYLLGIMLLYKEIFNE